MALPMPLPHPSPLRVFHPDETDPIFTLSSELPGRSSFASDHIRFVPLETIVRDESDISSGKIRRAYIVIYALKIFFGEGIAPMDSEIC